jgi:hypothetical protein
MDLSINGQRRSLSDALFALTGRQLRSLPPEPQATPG